MLQKHRYLLSTGGGTRTHMRLPSPDFESGASANSATPAKSEKPIVYGLFSMTKGSRLQSKQHLFGKYAAKLKDLGFSDACWVIHRWRLDYKHHRIHS